MKTSKPKQNKSFTTRMDDIRSEHDRGRKRAFKQLTLNVRQKNEISLSTNMPISKRQHI